MARSKLLTALDAQKGRNHRLEHQKKLRRAAEKRKSAQRQRIDEEGSNDDEELDSDHGGAAATSGVNGEKIEAPATDPLSHDAGDESELGDDDSKEPAGESTVAGINRAFEDEEEEDSDQDEEEDDIPLSDLESLPEEEKEDMIPHQRLTINNTAALRSALASISIPVSTLPFSEHQSLISTDPLSIPDVNDDLTREQAFYTSSLSGARLARSLLKKEGVPFSRPADFFAEMVKSDDHMGQVKKKLYDEAAAKKASVEARKQRDLKKFGKQVQIAKLQERDRAKKESLEKINSLKRKRKGAEKGATTAGDEDLFDIALDDSGTKSEKGGRSGRRNTDGSNFKRQKKDKKFGFGGKKRFSKSTDATSTADLSGFSVKKMKKGPAKRLGKSRRTK